MSVCVIHHQANQIPSLKTFVRFLSVFAPVSNKKKMADNTQKMSYNAGVAKGQAQEKTSTMMDKANTAAQSAMGSMQSAGQTVSAKAQGAAEAVKNATGMNK